MPADLFVDNFLAFTQDAILQELISALTVSDAASVAHTPNAKSGG